jgi:hypothetical protein
MNKEQTKEAIRVMQAFVDGKGVVSMRTPNVTADDPYWNWNDDTEMYRIKPTPVIRPWTADEVPLGAWIRKKQYVSSRGVVIYTGDELCRQAWLEYSEHSTDNGKTWKECGVMEESK